jgi:hypothetical protein
MKIVRGLMSTSHIREISSQIAGQTIRKKTLYTQYTENKVYNTYADANNCMSYLQRSY